MCCLLSHVLPPPPYELDAVMPCLTTGDAAVTTCARSPSQEPRQPEPEPAGAPSRRPTPPSTLGASAEKAQGRCSRLLCRQQLHFPGSLHGRATSGPRANAPCGVYRVWVTMVQQVLLGLVLRLCPEEGGQPGHSHADSGERPSHPRGAWNTGLSQTWHSLSLPNDAKPSGRPSDCFQIKRYFGDIPIPPSAV